MLVVECVFGEMHECIYALFAYANSTVGICSQRALLCRRVFNYFVELAPSIDDLHTAAAFVRLLLTVLEKTSSNADSNKKQLLGVAEDFLRKDWPRTGLENRIISKCAQVRRVFVTLEIKG